MPTPSNNFITSAEVCAVLGIDRSTLSRWVSTGRIHPAIKSPGLRGPRFFDPREVERVLTERGEQS